MCNAKEQKMGPIRPWATEVVDRAPAYDAGRMKFKLLDTGLTGAPRGAIRHGRDRHGCSLLR